MTEHPFRIICGDDGPQILFRGACPKCGGESGWIPAGHISVPQFHALQRILEISDGADVTPAKEGGE